MPAVKLKVSHLKQRLNFNKSLLAFVVKFLFVSATGWLPSAYGVEGTLMVSPRTVNGSVSVEMHLDDPNNCFQELHPLFVSLQDYLSAQAGKSSKAAESSFHQFQKLEAGVQKKCQETAFEMTSIFSSLVVFWGQPAESVFQWIDILSFVQRQHMIRPLNVQVSEKLKIPISQKPMGAYSCEGHQIWLDPRLRPYNRGTVLLHEVEHWARNLALTFLKNNDSLPAQLFTSADYLIFDESLSSLHGGVAQVQTRSNLNRRQSGQVERWRFPLKINKDLQFWWRKETKFFDAKNDLNLYSPKGQLIQLWEERIRSEGVDREATYVELLRDHFFTTDVAGEKTENIYHFVQSIYEPNRPHLGFDAYAITNAIINGSLNHLMPLVDPLQWVHSLSEQETQELINSRWCDLNRPGNGGAEGVGLLLSDQGARLRKSGLRACLPPLEGI